jgi:hypothetical protein
MSRWGTWLAIVVLFGWVGATGCHKDDEEPRGKFGDSCDPASDRCDDGLECSPEADGSGTCARTVAASCEPDAANGGCAERLECMTDAEGASTCLVPTGGVCDPELDNGGCAADDECAVKEPLVLLPAAAGAEGGAGGAGGGDAEPQCLVREGGECDPAEELCANGLVCADLAAGGHRCFLPVVIRGTVTDTSDGAPIEGAHVIAVDEEGVAVSDVAVTDGDGAYALPVPVDREEDGTPVDAAFTLRAAAQDHQPFPSGARVALPLRTSTARDEDIGSVMDNAITAIGLIPLPEAERFWIEGTLVGADGLDSALGGVLVLAVGDAGSFSAVTDRSGAYTIFNVPDGVYQVSAYAAEMQVESQEVTVDGGEVADIDLGEVDRATTTVSGTIQIVNAPGGALTSVILVVADTFDADAARGEVPRGLRAPRSGPPDVDGAFTIEGVPDGSYVVLAAWENDDLVRDPDTNIAGTDFVTIDVDASESTTVDLADSFKVTEALATFGPGAEEAEAVDGPPTLRWADDSSEDYYEVRVFDAFGDEVWSALDVPGESGVEEVSVEYDGPLDPGMYYQFRVTSWRQPGGGNAAPISATEDLRGVFFLPAP